MRNHQEYTYQMNNGVEIKQMPSDNIVVAKKMMPKFISAKSGKVNC